MSTSCNILFENPKEVYYSGEMLRGTIYLTLTAPSMTMPSPPNLPDSNITSFHSMMPTSCQISFDHPEKVYYAGELLRGTVNLTLTREYNVRGVYIRIYGKAKTYWSRYCNSKHSNRSTSNHHVIYEGKEYYLDSKIYVVGGTNGEIRLQPGTYNYAFQYLLPAKLPTSIEHKVGYITYGAKVTMDIPLWVDKKFKSHFTVIKRIDLNADPLYRSSVTDKNVKVFYPLGCFCCCPSGPLEVSAFTPVRGYTPGQIINLKLNVSNASKEPVHKFEVELIKKITFHARSSTLGHIGEQRSKIYKYTIIRQDTRGCQPNQNDLIDVDLSIPSIPPTDCTTSSIVQVRYYIRIEGSIDACCSGNVKLKLPITIGTYPIRDVEPASNVFTISYPRPIVTDQPRAQQIEIGQIAPNAPPMPMPMPMSMSMPIPSAPALPESNINTSFDPNDALPTYEEAMGIDAENKNNFRPKYPMFNRQTSYSRNNN